MNEKTFFYNKFASDFDRKMNMYDTDKRLNIIFNKLLKSENMEKKKFLDAGSGTGWFSKKAVESGADVISLDIGIDILNVVSKKCKTKRTVGSSLELPFSENTFDYVLATEMIEHTPNPKQVIKELSRVLKPEGTLILTVPNKIWKWAILLANFFKLRPYEGLENWLGYRELKKSVQKNNIDIQEYFGFHIIPFVFKSTYPFITFFDSFGYFLGPIMLNIGLKGKKKKS